MTRDVAYARPGGNFRRRRQRGAQSARRTAEYGAIKVKPAGDTEVDTFSKVLGRHRDPAKFTNVILRECDRVMLGSPGGGGFGDRREHVAHDVAKGIVLRRAARQASGSEES